MGGCLGTPVAAGMGSNADAAKRQVDTVSGRKSLQVTTNTSGEQNAKK